MNECCTIFWINNDESGVNTSPPPDNPQVCSDCNCYCGYLQYENLLPYLKEIRASLKQDVEESSEFEFRLREQILEISRLFDIENGVAPGYFTKSHYVTTKLFNTATSSGSRYLKVPDFVQGTMEVRTSSNHLLDPSSYLYENGFLVYRPCSQEGHRISGCGCNCSYRRCSVPIHWPHGCYQITARWGSECADMAVQMAIRDYLIATYRLNDPVSVQAAGLQVYQGFKVPYSWTSYVKNFKAKRALFSQFAFA